MKQAFLLLLSATLLSSCTYCLYPPKIKTVTSQEFRFKYDKNHNLSKWKKFKTPLEYIKYDEKGNKIEVGKYGERWAKMEHTKDTIDGKSFISTTIYHGTYPKRLNMVTYYTYNDSNQITKEENWLFRNNKPVSKNVLTYFDNGLVKETDFDENGQIVSEDEYHLESSEKSDTQHVPMQNNCSEIRDEYIYDKRKLLKKIMHYDREGLRGLTKYKYKLY
jgi:hypothetical protein